LIGFEFLTPEEREALLLVTSSGLHVIHSSFSPLPDTIPYQKYPGTYPNQVCKHLIQILTAQPALREIFVDASTLFLEEYQAIEQALKGMSLGIKLATLDREKIWSLRRVKDELEIGLLKKSAHIAAQSFKKVRSQLQVGMTEKQVCEMIEAEFRSQGTKKPAFPTIVAFGANSTLPHYQPGDVQLQDNMPVLIDMGAKFERYCSDMTRTFWFGNQPEAKFQEIEQIVKDAYQAALGKLGQFFGSQAPGNSTLQAKDLDAAARGVIEQADQGEFFIHTTGHGVGLDIHEPPSLNWHNEFALAAGMAITIEPGIYLPDLFGYRHENTVLLTPTGPLELTL